MQEGENIFQLYHNRQQPLSIGNWCDSFAEKEPQVPQEAVKQTRTPKAKISIKRFQNKTVKHLACKSSNSLPLSANLTEVLRPAPFKVETRQVMPKMHFIYRSNTYHSMPSGSLQLERHSASTKTIKIVENFTQPHDISMEIRDQPEAINQEMAIANDDLKSTRKKVDHHQVNQQEEAVSILAQGDHDQQLLHLEKKESKEDNPKALIKSQQIFTQPKALIGSGNLFGAVRRSQTILNDYKSQSSQQSEVLEDFKSLMSKIQQHKLEEEEFQQK